MDLAVGTEAVEQKRDADPATEADVGHDAVRRDRQRIDRGGDVLSVAEVERHAHETPRHPRGMAELARDAREESMSHIHGVILRAARGLSCHPNDDGGPRWAPVGDP